MLLSTAHITDINSQGSVSDYLERANKKNYGLVWSNTPAFFCKGWGQQLKAQSWYLISWLKYKLQNSEISSSTLPTWPPYSVIKIL